MKSRHQLFTQRSHPGFGAFAGIGGQPRRQRLKDVKDAPVARRPHGKGRQRQQNADHGHADQLSQRNPARPIAAWQSQSTSAGANATAASAPSGRNSAAQVTAKVNQSALAQPGSSRNRAIAHMASASIKSVGASASGATV